MEKFSRDRTCFKEGKEAFQNADHMNRSGKKNVVPEGHRDAVQPRSLKPRKNKTGNISSGSFPQLGERKGQETFPLGALFETTKTVYYFMQTRVLEVKWKWMLSNLWPGMHLGSVFKKRKLGVALSIPVLSRPDLPRFGRQLNSGKEKDEYVCCLSQGTHGTMQKQWGRRKEQVLLKTWSMPEIKPRKKTLI